MLHYLKILVKMRSWLGKMELWFRTYSFVSLLGQIDPKWVIRPHRPLNEDIELLINLLHFS